MTESQVARALGQRQRLDLMGDIVGGLSHELNNALSVAGGQAELLAERLGDAPEAAGEVESGVRKVVDWVQRAATLSTQFVDLSRTLRGSPGRVDMGHLTRSAAELFRYRCEREGLIIFVETGEPAPFVDGSPGPLHQAIANLIQNSREALGRAGEGGAIRVAATEAEAWARIEVEDDGPGIATDAADQVFEPFCTGQEDESGAGLGLTVARWIAREHGGDLTLRSSVEGTLATLVIPLAHD